MKLILLQAALLLLGAYAFLLAGSLIEALTPSPVGTILVILLCFWAGDWLLEQEEQERKRTARRDDKNKQ